MVLLVPESYSASLLLSAHQTHPRNHLPFQSSTLIHLKTNRILITTLFRSYHRHHLLLRNSTLTATESCPSNLSSVIFPPSIVQPEMQPRPLPRHLFLSPL